MLDIVKARPELFLGSRLKRLAERMQADVVRVAEAAGLAVQPSQYPLLMTLDVSGPLTIGELVQALELSQPAVTRTVGNLAKLGLVDVARNRRDLRRKTVSLTPAGEAALARSKLAVFPRIQAAVEEITRELQGSIFEQISAVEAKLAERPLDRRAEGALPRLHVREFSDELAPAFYSINAEWIADMYRLEQTDIDVLSAPRERIIDPGGTILFVEAEGLGVVGTCALQKTGERQFELTKMGVLAKARGLKVGEFLLRAVIERAERLGADTLYLLSNKKSAAAIHLYEKLGFAHDDGIMRRFGARYERCDVAMRYRPERA